MSEAEADRQAHEDWRIPDRLLRRHTLPSDADGPESFVDTRSTGRGGRK